MDETDTDETDTEKIDTDNTDEAEYTYRRASSDIMNDVEVFRAAHRREENDELNIDQEMMSETSHHHSSYYEHVGLDTGHNMPTSPTSGVTYQSSANPDQFSSMRSVPPALEMHSGFRNATVQSGLAPFEPGDVQQRWIASADITASGPSGHVNYAHSAYQDAAPRDQALSTPTNSSPYHREGGGTSFDNGDRPKQRYGDRGSIHRETA
ncbi:uncharacterized protein TRAVEDRAFT_51982 [Trametes versicolor FP-101664 SS1]|uniref:uncharacterized protein n=1 Tax=Trametes versicolor (strain FP-101664) TaxID=717944 RepID=UPI0004621897|nr:uncharacterized protein TRAVEDRAFT_51982 [Trametes versicolor FP-101664 SS1]EIW54270.1 hypothetical protein TRAVEDRAFT_51982 [Trametes versicolor FP-101664 SS1]